jgi:hypothetical protein
MRLPHLSPENKDLILCFAAAATKHSGDANDRIARSGPLSIFAAFSACVPGVLRGAAGFTKSGVTETAFNHALEKDVRAGHLLATPQLLRSFPWAHVC